MRVSVIFTTYNSVDWLQKVLWGYAAQAHQDFEIIVADDGSGAETAACINAAKAELGLDIKHVWQRDQGFRKCRILNKAILQAKSEYLVFSDGDCIPRKDFLAVHIARAAPQYFLSGSYCKLPMETSSLIARPDIQSQRCFDYQWLRTHGMPAGRKNLKLKATARCAPLLNRLTTTSCNFKGSNASAWKSDILAVNGFDERMQWGGLDRELGVRLGNLGVAARHVRYDAIVVHLDHGRGYRDPEMVAANRALRIRVAKEKITRTDHGIAQLPEADHPAS